MSKTLKDKVKSDLSMIRDTLDTDVIDSCIEMVSNKALRLTQLSGLCAESQAAARKILENARLFNLSEIQHEKIPVSLMLKKLDAMCADEVALHEYAVRISAGVSHSLDMLRSYIALYRTELENSIKEPKTTH